MWTTLQTQISQWKIWLKNMLILWSFKRMYSKWKKIIKKKNKKKSNLTVDQEI